MYSNGTGIAIGELRELQNRPPTPSGMFHESLDNLSIKSCMEYESPVPPDPIAD